MSLYIAVFVDSDTDREVDGVEVGPLEDFNAFRARVAQEFFGGDWSAGFPVLLGVPDNGPGWDVENLASLVDELKRIRSSFICLPPIHHSLESWQGQVQKSLGLEQQNLHESYFDIDGEPLIDRLVALAEQGVEARRPLEFT